VGELGALYSMQAAGVAANAGNTYAQNQAAQGQQSYSSQMAQLNSNAAAMEAADATRRGDINASRSELQGKQYQSTGTTQAAAGGTAVTSGPAAVLRNDAKLMAGVDAITQRNNAYRAALGLKQEQANILSQDKFSRLATRNKARNSLFQLGAEAGYQGTKAAYYGEKYKGLE
jgi:hypothetical protein